MNRRNVFLACLAWALTSGLPAAEPKPVKVFLLAGQSNMVGAGKVSSLDWLGEDPVHGAKLAQIKRPDGSWVVRDDVFAWFKRAGRDGGTVKKGPLTVGFGSRDDTVGPELMFGIEMGDAFEEPVLLIKTAWGGRDVIFNFRSPSSGNGPYTAEKMAEMDAKAAERAGPGGTFVPTKERIGLEYRMMIAEIKECLANMDKDFPELKGRGYEIMGFVWFQGWNDMIKHECRPEYTEYRTCLANMIRDLRKDLGQPGLPVVIGELGCGGLDLDERAQAGAGAFRKAQAAVAETADLKGTVVFSETARYWDEQHEALAAEAGKKKQDLEPEKRALLERMGGTQGYHYLNSGKIYSLMGYGFAQDMKKLLRLP